MLGPGYRFVHFLSVQRFAYFCCQVKMRTGQRLCMVNQLYPYIVRFKEDTSSLLSSKDSCKVSKRPHQHEDSEKAALEVAHRNKQPTLECTEQGAQYVHTDKDTGQCGGSSVALPLKKPGHANHMVRSMHA